jgi:hypothetical protein
VDYSWSHWGLKEETMDTVLQMSNPLCRIIFLDIDGVLNTAKGHYIDREMMSRLKGVVDAFEAKIVLSSMWRLRKKYRKEIKRYMSEEGLPKPISYTPCIKNGRDRVMEILSWLYVNTTNVCLDGIQFGKVEEDDEFETRHYLMPNRLAIDQFVVIDDLNLRHERYGPYRLKVTKHHFVRTAGDTGFTEYNAKQVSHLFETKILKLCHLAPPSFCDYCQTNEPIMKDKVANKFFCQSDCQALFYDKYRL